MLEDLEVQAAESRTGRARRSMRETLRALADDPSLPEATKLRIIIHLTALTCAIIVVQPLPFTELFILSPVQVVMVIVMSRVMGRPQRQRIRALVISVVAVAVWGLLAQQVVLGLYRSAIPLLGGFTPVPLVYAATFALGYVAKAILDARRRDQQVSRVEIRGFAKQATAEAKQGQRGWSLGAISAAAPAQANNQDQVAQRRPPKPKPAAEPPIITSALLGLLLSGVVIFAGLMPVKRSNQD